MEHLFLARHFCMFYLILVFSQESIDVGALIADIIIFSLIL